MTSPPYSSSAPSCHYPSFSAEFFPPRGIPAQERLLRTGKSLQGCHLDFVSVTFGAGGSTQTGTLKTLQTLKALGFDVVPHISAIGCDGLELEALLQTYKDLGVRRLVVLRGDAPSGMGAWSGQEMRYASDLVDFIRHHFGDSFYITVAAYPEKHPEAASLHEDLSYFVQKMRAGANAAITQYFFSIEAYENFVDQAIAKGIEQPIIPGIMPITNVRQFLRFSDSCGAEVPRWIRLRLAELQHDPASVKAFGLDVATRLCDRLLAIGAPGLHFYTLNQSRATLHVLRALETTNTQLVA